MSLYCITYDFGDVSGITQWKLHKDGIVLSVHPSWEAANAEKTRLEWEEQVAA